ncbi:hypothetical protein [Streptomyces wuyuanensis]|uniref:hypothetical protein n=1 Tax=Streptomyces wuyuanensis TaxID=1196353 RepID=UPI0036D02E13
MQEVLARLAASGDLTSAQLAEMSAAVPFRAEKKLGRARLVLLGKALRRDPDRAAELLPVAEAFGHEDTAVPERTLKRVARPTGPGRGGDGRAEDPRREPAGSADLLSPMHRAYAAEVFGEQLDPATSVDAPYEEVLPPVPAARVLKPAPDSVAETVEPVAALTNSHPRPSGDFERALDGLVRQAYRNRAALVEAPPAGARRPVVAAGRRGSRPRPAGSGART